MVVIEAAALGTPTVVVAGPDNAAVELIEEGGNGFGARGPDDLPRAVAAAHEGGDALRSSTAAWFAERAPELSAGRQSRACARRMRRYPRRSLPS